MKILYHYPTCPISRQARVIMKEMGAEFSLIKEDYWLKRSDFLQLNPAGTLPVLQEADGLILSGIYPILEYIKETNQLPQFMSNNASENANIRRLLSWVNEKFYREVVKIVLDEKLIRLLSGKGAPRSEYLRAAKSNQHYHLSYLSQLLEAQGFLALEKLTFADIAAASHISVLDYFDEINWDKWSELKEWYSILKSRPSFRPILQDKIAGFYPSPTYAELDF